MTFYLDLSQENFHIYTLKPKGLTFIEVDLNEDSLPNILKASLDQVAGVFILFEEQLDLNFEKCFSHHFLCESSYAFINRSIRKRLLNKKLSEQEGQLFERLIKQLG